MFRARTERRPQRAPQGFKPRYAVVQPESPNPHRRWAVPGARGRACACIPPRDLRHHYGEYWRDKARRRAEVEQHEEEFHQTAMLVTKQFRLPPAAESRRTRVAWAFLEKCLERGPGMTLTVLAN